MRPSGLFRRLHQYRRRLFRLNFYRCHLAYFVLTILITSAVFYGANPSHGFRVGYADSLFMATSAMTTTGLNTVNLGSVTGYQQSILFVLMLLGDLSTVSISVVVVRRIFFRKFMNKWVREHKGAQQMVDEIDAESSNATPSKLRRPSGKAAEHRSNDQRNAREGTVTKDSVRRRKRDVERHHSQFGGLAAPWETSLWKRAIEPPLEWLEGRTSAAGKHHYLSFEPELDHKGRMRSLTADEYAELGGVEYRALKHLCWILPSYTAFWILLAMIILGPYASGYNPVADTVRTTQPGDLNPGWWGVFISMASYTNCGLDPVNSSMIPFRRDWLVLIVSGGAIMAGNTFYPIFLRAYIWMISKCIPRGSELHHAIAFLLHHPRRCYLWLFDEKTTWILTAVQFALIFGEWILFEILNIRQTAIWALDAGTRTMDGLYQTFGTRSAGFYIVQISSIAPGLKVIYMVVMYLSVFPLIVSLRTTNVYEERSIGLEADEYENNSTSGTQEDKAKKGPSPAQHIRNQLAYDLWWIVLSWILIAIIEEAQLNDDASGWSIFAILFEIVSAYGNCGLSLGVPYDSYSFSGTFHTLSKLILISVMLRGRHRILPMAVDRSILIPGQGLMEEMDRHYNPKLRSEDEHKVREEERGAQAEQGGKQDPEQPDARKESSDE